MNKPDPSTKKDVSMVRSPAAEYQTFVAAAGLGGVEAVFIDGIVQDRLLESDFDRMLQLVSKKALPGGADE